MINKSKSFKFSIVFRRPFGVEQEFFVQLFLDFDKSMKLTTLEDLLKKMFKEQNISFTEVIYILCVGLSCSFRL